jgi:RecA-family ATPase
LNLDAAMADSWDCPPLTWVVEPMIALENLVIVAAETQTGKTLLGLYLSRQIATGGLLFGKYKTSPMKVCYFALEDPVRRIRDRVIDINSGLPPDVSPLPRGRFTVAVAPQFNLADRELILYLETVIQQEQYQVVVIDTYQRATPGLTSFDDEQQSVILHRLSALTRKHRIALIVLDHLRKKRSRGTKQRVTIADIKGTGGKAQNADAVILLERAGGELLFSCNSKESDDWVRIRLAVSRQGGIGHKFQFLDQQCIDLRPSSSRDAKCEKVLSAFAPGEQLACAELIKRARLSRSTVDRALKELLQQGAIRTNDKRGRWIRYSTV